MVPTVPTPPTGTVRRTVARAVRSVVPDAAAPQIDELATTDAVGGSGGPVEGDVDRASDEVEELRALRRADATGPDDPAARAQRSAAAYLDARRARLRRELRSA